jgi:MFS family permease
MIFGPIIGGLLGALGWRYPAFLASALSILAIILTLRVLIESMPKDRINDLRLKKEELKKNSIKLEKTFTREIITRFVQVFLLFMITVMFNSSMSLVLYERYGATELAVGMVMTLAGVIVMIYGGILMKPLFKKFGERRILYFSIILLFFNFGIFPFLYELWMIYAIIPTFVFSMVFAPSLIQSNITKAVDQDSQGTVSGMTTNIQSVAQIIAPLVATGFIEIGAISIGLISLNSYELIGFTAILFATILLVIVYFGTKKHSYLYDY